MSILEKPAKVIRDITTIVGAVAAISAFFVNVFPDTYGGRWMSEKWGQLFNAPTGAIGYVYYEVGPNGAATDDGQLVALPEKNRPSLAEITAGQTFMTVSTVRLRSEDTAPNHDNIIDKLGSGKCVVLIKVSRVLRAEDLQDAQEAAWFEVAATRCPQQ